MKKILIGLSITVILLGILVGAAYLFRSGGDKIPVSDLNLDVPYKIDNSKVKKGEYPGERSTTIDGKKTQELGEIDTKHFFIYSYNSIPSISGKSTDLWIENRSINEQNIQVYVIDPSNNTVIYISPLLKPGEYVEKQELLSTQVKQGVGYEVWNCLYSKDDKLSGLVTSALNFTEK